MSPHAHRAPLVRLVLYLATAALVVSVGAAATARERARAAESRTAAKNAAVHIAARIAARSQPERSASLVFVGDIMLSRAIGRIMASEGDWSYPFREIRDELSAADLTVGNLEGPISDRGANQGSIYSFRADPRAVAGLADAGFDVLTVANNHIWDYGPDAVRDTLAYLSSFGIAAVGGGEDHARAHAPAVLTVNNIRIAFLGYTSHIPRSRDDPDASPASAYLDFDTALADIARARTEAGGGADIVAVLIHWGNEYETSASSLQRDIAHALIDNGATLVIGHHPHVVQEVEQYGTGLIAYSLGNFVFDQNFSPDTRRGLLLRVILNRKGIEAFEEIPIAFTETFQPYVMMNDQ